MANIIDRRQNGGNKSAVNRKRFLRRYKEQIKNSVAKGLLQRSITDIGKGEKVHIPQKDTSEPNFEHGSGGTDIRVYPGNKEFYAGDKIPRQSAGGSSKGRSGGGDGNDDFTFALSKDEFLDIVFEDLELPRLVRSALGTTEDFKWCRAGFTQTGVPANLSLTRTMFQSFARRITREAFLKRELEKLENKEAPPEEIDALKKKIALPAHFFLESDLRYRNRVKVPQPVVQAVMFCVMDVSGSMTEEKKGLAKRFFTLLYLFLSRKYEKVEVVFIRHTETAEEVDENTFFHDPRSGGTVVLSALELLFEIMNKRFPAASWNIYGAQVSDGDAFGGDPEKSRAFLGRVLLPLMRYFVYVEVPDQESTTGSGLAQAYQEIRAENFAMKEVFTPRDVYPVLRELFKKELGQIAV